MSNQAAQKISIVGIIVAVMLNVSVNYGCAQPLTINPRFSVEKIFTAHFEPSSMIFLGPDDILLLDRDEGKVYRITNGVQSKPLLDVKVATDGYRGLLGVAVSVNEKPFPSVFLYYTEAGTHDGDDATKNPVNPLGNRL